ncbi:hypothetical protein Q4R51_22690, partial [Morganella morganii]
AYGMGGFTLYRRIVLPSALRRALPYFSNEVILMLHSTSVAFTATVPDLLKVARDVNSATYAPFLSFGIAGGERAGGGGGQGRRIGGGSGGAGPREQVR